MIAEAKVILARQFVSAATNVNKNIPVITKRNRGTVRHGNIYPGSVEVIKGRAFVNSRVVETSPRLVRDSEEIRQTDVIQKEFIV
jgi:hypothetical protein